MALNPPTNPPTPSWFTQVWQIAFASQDSGATANRPTKNLWTGRPYFDTTLGRPIWWNGGYWIDAAGNSV